MVVSSGSHKGDSYGSHRVFRFMSFMQFYCLSKSYEVHGFVIREGGQYGLVPRLYCPAFFARSKILLRVKKAVSACEKSWAVEPGNEARDSV